MINLLVGLATCGQCGGGIIVEQSNNKKGRYKYYICHRRKIHGTCTNTLRIPAPEMNEAVLQAIEERESRLAEWGRLLRASTTRWSTVCACGGT